MTRGALLRWRQHAGAHAAAVAALAPLPPSAVAVAAAPRRAAENGEAAAEAEALETAAEKERTFASPGLFANTDPEHMRMATAASPAASPANSAANSAAALPPGSGQLREAREEECSVVITPPFLREARAAAVRAARSEAMRGGLGGLFRGDNQRMRAPPDVLPLNGGASRGHGHGHARPAAREATSAVQDAPPEPLAPAPAEPPRHPAPAPTAPPAPVELSGLARAVARAEARAAQEVTARAPVGTASLRPLWRRWKRRVARHRAAQRERARERESDRESEKERERERQRQTSRDVSPRRAQALGTAQAAVAAAAAAAAAAADRSRDRDRDRHAQKGSVSQQGATKGSVSQGGSNAKRGVTAVAAVAVTRREGEAAARLGAELVSEREARRAEAEALRGEVSEEPSTLE